MIKKKGKIRRRICYRLGESVQVESFGRRKERKKYNVIVNGEKIPATFHWFYDAQSTAFKHFKNQPEFIQ
jgi:uncharacterized protein Veg